MESKGEGINHVGIFVKDIHKKIAELEKRGLKLIQSGTGRRKGGFAYFDTGEAGGGLLLELIEWEEMKPREVVDLSADKSGNLMTS